jgi:glycosyltransferase involved in cell wall biosynthesis
VALEAVACATPVVATRVGGLPEHVEPGVTGALYEPGDIDGLVAGVGAVLSGVRSGTMHPALDPHRWGLTGTGERLAELTERLVADRSRG